MLRRKSTPGGARKVRNVDLAPAFIQASKKSTSIKPTGPEISFSQFRQQLVLKLSSNSQWKQQLIFAVPIVLLFALLSHLNRYTIFTRYQRSLSATAPLPNNEWAFQLPTELTARIFYNHEETPHLLQQYAQFHKERIVWNPFTEQYILKPDTPYLRYQWCPQVEPTFLEEVSSLHLFWKFLGMTSGDDGPVSSCQSSTDVVQNLDGLLTAFYVAMMTDRVLIVQDNHSTKYQTGVSLLSSVEQNSVHWNVSLHLKVKSETDDDNNNDDGDDNEILQLTTPQDLEDLCYAFEDDSPLGVEVATTAWLGETHLANSLCWKKYWSRVGRTAPIDKKSLYRWGFWTLFKIHPTILRRADQQRVAAGLPTSATGIHMGVTSFQPYYFAAKHANHTTADTFHKKSESLMVPSNAVTATTNDEKTECAQQLFHAAQSLSRSNQHNLHRALYTEGLKEAKLIDSSTQEKQKRLKTPSNSNMDDRDWYSQFWADLVVAVESECLLFHTSHDEVATAAAVAQRISVSNPDTEKRCYIDCETNRNGESLKMKMKLIDSLSWAEEEWLNPQEEVEGTDNPEEVVVVEEE